MTKYSWMDQVKLWKTDSLHKFYLVHSWTLCLIWWWPKLYIVVLTSESLIASMASRSFPCRNWNFINSCAAWKTKAWTVALFYDSIIIKNTPYDSFYFVAYHESIIHHNHSYKLFYGYVFSKFVSFPTHKIPWTHDLNFTIYVQYAQRIIYIQFRTYFLKAFSLFPHFTECRNGRITDYIFKYIIQK